ncbi:SDR family NAD(P)-dependent oxidoreductase [Niallia circulans]|uniref:SDR family NAD(P)-dependent oxidoreductase n=1 Tax=Niallia circulans TaxID=1397 RepID=A0A553SM91_NIACI|nr:SDR family NAD(P)-dependent oxidoreductase [Niallia circulans]TRZ38111.1 SDR family NAD(P)-dependent oxidoreductase [Niallia circulans]
MFDLSLNNKVVLVTGVDDMLGAAICKKLAEAGAIVWIHRFHTNEAVDLHKEIRSMGGLASVITSDLQTANEVQAVVKKIIEQNGKIDVLINYADKSAKTTINQLTPSAWLAAFQVNLDVPFLCCQAIIPIMLGLKGGTIINITSQAASTGDVGPAYAAGKSAFQSFTKGLATEFTGTTIKVKEVVAPISLHDQNSSFQAKNKVMKAVANKILLLCTPYLDEEIEALDKEGLNK